MTTISPELARQLCAEISAANRRKWYTIGSLWCRGCARFNGDAAGRPDMRSCMLVKARYARLQQIEHELQPNEF